MWDEIQIDETWFQVEYNYTPAQSGEREIGTGLLLSPHVPEELEITLVELMAGERFHEIPGEILNYKLIEKKILERIHNPDY